MDIPTLAPAPDGAALPAATAAPTTPLVRPGGRVHQFWRGRPEDPAWARPALIGLLLATVVAYTWNLTASGWANSFYSAAAQAGSVDWKAFFFGSSDAANSITVDKPPASLWVMALSVRALGLTSFAILFPQVLMGVASVAVVHQSVRRVSGSVAGLLAGLVLALTPVAALMFRFNNPDALLTLLMVLATWAVIRATEVASWRWFALAGVFLGFGFLTKALQVLLVVPFLGIAYLVAAPTTLKRRVLHSLVGIGAFLVSAGWWVAIVELVPASARPYIGGSQDNSFLGLTFGYNGFGRLTGNETGSVGGGNGWGLTGPDRMFAAGSGGQISWLIPAALVLLGAGLWFRRRMPRTDLRRAAYLAWGGWLLVTMAVFSFMAGIYHDYYTVALAPAIAALVGMGAVEAWERRESLAARVVLAVAVAVSGGWAWVLLGRTDAYGAWLSVAILVAALAAAVMLLGLTLLPRRVVVAALALAVGASLAGPAAYTLSTLSVGHAGSIVSAGPAGRFGGGPGLGGGRNFAFGPGAGQPGGGFPGGGLPGGGFGGGGGLPGGGFGGGGPAGGGFGGGAGGLLEAAQPSTAVVAALSADASRYTWVAATVGSQNAAGLQLGSQLPVMAIGGFNGSDPSPTFAQFRAFVTAGEIHWFTGNGRGGGFGGQMGGSSDARQITAWVEENFTAVQIDGTTFYDLTQPVSAGATTAPAEVAGFAG